MGHRYVMVWSIWRPQNFFMATIFLPLFLSVGFLLIIFVLPINCFSPLKNNGIKFYLSPFTILHFLALLFPSFPAALSGKNELPVVVNLGRHVEGRINHSSIGCSVGGDGGDLSIFQWCCSLAFYNWYNIMDKTKTLFVLIAQKWWNLKPWHVNKAPCKNWFLNSLYWKILSIV